jgi:predicted nucleic acid-binding protein
MTRKYLLDSDVLIDVLNGRKQILRFLSRLREDDLAMSLLAYGEVLIGELKRAGLQEAKSLLSESFGGIPIIPLDEQTIDQFALLGSQLRQRGNAIAEADLLIAATAIQHGRILVTRNLRHFNRVPGLEILDPSKENPS